MQRVSATPESPRMPARVGTRQPHYVRRRLVAIMLLAAVVFTLGVVVGSSGATAELANPVAGHAVVGEGETLWDVALRTAPNGVDPRQQLAEIRDLNGLTASDVNVWTVVALPAH